MANPTVTSGNAQAQDSKVYFSNLLGADYKVASVTTTTITLDDTATYNGDSLYASSEPGQVIIKSSAAGTTNHGKTANITARASGVLTVDVDFSTGGELVDGDVITVLPPIAVEVATSGGHSLAATRSHDFTRGLGDTFQTQVTPLSTAVGGDLPIFATIDSETFGRVLLAGTGGYKKSGTGVHDYIPFKADDGTFAEVNDYTITVSDGNEVVRQAFYGLFGTALSLTVPNNGVATASLSSLGSGVVREVGGAGKTFTEGANNYLRTVPCDNAQRFSSTGALVELGGSFGDAITDAADTYVKDLTVNITRGAQEDNILGNQFIAKPDEVMHEITISGTRILENDTYYENYYGSATSADPEQPTTTRMLVVLTTEANASRTLTVDCPNGIFEEVTTQRQDGRFEQSFTYRGIPTLDASDCIDTANPLYRLRYNNNDDTDYGAAL